MTRKPLYYFNTPALENAAGPGKQATQAARFQSTWEDIEEKIDNLSHTPRKMYYEGIFTYNNSIMVIQPEKVEMALNALYMLPEGNAKRLLLKLAALGASLVPCEEHDLLMAWHKEEKELLRKERAGEIPSGEEIGRQSVYLLTRNKVIGQVVAQSLSKDEAGIIFLNHLHNLGGMMSESYLKNTLGLHVIEMNPDLRLGKQTPSH